MERVPNQELNFAEQLALATAICKKSVQQRIGWSQAAQSAIGAPEVSLQPHHIELLAAANAYSLIEVAGGAHLTSPKEHLLSYLNSTSPQTLAELSDKETEAIDDEEAQDMRELMYAQLEPMIDAFANDDWIDNMANSKEVKLYHFLEGEVKEDGIEAALAKLEDEASYRLLMQSIYTPAELALWYLRSLEQVSTEKLNDTLKKIAINMAKTVFAQSGEELTEEDLMDLQREADAALLSGPMPMAAQIRKLAAETAIKDLKEIWGLEALDYLPAGIREVLEQNS